MIPARSIQFFARKREEMQTYVIKPIVLSKVNSEKGPMTYLTYHGVPVVRPYVMWYIGGASRNILVDTAIEAEDYRNSHPCFNKHPFEALQSFEEGLSTVGCEPDDIEIVIQTHLHLDHVYNAAKCRNAEVYVQKKELEFALNPHPIFEVFFPGEIIRKLQFQTVDGDCEILPGIELLSAPGHTPGCQAVAVQTEKGKAVITGCCTTLDNFTPPEDAKTAISPFATYPIIAPGIHTDLFAAYESAVRIKQLADIIIPMHDPLMASKERIPW